LVNPFLFNILNLFLLGTEFEKPKLVSNWKLNFMQPACDMVKLRATVKQQNVSLENAVVNNETCKLFGTVLVTNMPFEKQVIKKNIQYTLLKCLFASFKPLIFEIYSGIYSTHIQQLVDTHRYAMCLQDGMSVAIKISILRLNFISG
jgi:hypothetical protein